MFARMKIGSKILGTYAVVAALMIVLLIVAFRALTGISDVARHLSAQTVPNVISVATFNEAETDVGRALFALELAEPGTRARADHLLALEAAFKRIDTSWRDFDGRAKSPEATRLFQELRAPWDRWLQSARRIAELQKTFDRTATAAGADTQQVRSARQQIQSAMAETTELYQAAMPLIDRLQEYQNSRVSGVAQEAEGLVTSATIMLAVVISVMILFIFVIGTLVGRDVGRIFATISEYLGRLARGDVPPPLTEIRGADFNAVRDSLNGCIGAINALVSESITLTGAAVEGRLATRADCAKFQGDYRKIVQGVNDTLDAVIGPLNVAAEYVDRISKGDIPAKITDAYKGDFNEIKNNLNTCIDAVGALVAEADALTRAAVEGKLSTRADASKVQGDYRKIVQGVNATLDAVIGPLNVSADASNNLFWTSMHVFRLFLMALKSPL